MKRLWMKSMALLLALLLCLSVIGCHPETDNGEDTTQETTADTTADSTEGTTEAVVEREPIVVDYEGDLTPGGTPEIRAEYADLAYVGKGMPAFYYTEEQAIDLLEQIEDLYVIFKTGTPEDLREAYDQVKNGALAEMKTQSTLAMAEYNLYFTDPEAEENYLWMEELYDDATGRMEYLCLLVYDSPAAEVFFKGWSETDIRVALAHGKGYDEEMRALNRELDELIVEYHKLMQQEDYMETTAALYPELVRINNTIAQKMGYDDYMDYAYESIYLREYAPEDVAQIRKLVKEQLIPLYNQVKQELEVMEAQFATMSEEEVMAVAASLEKLESITKDSPELLLYMQGLGESFGATYAELLEKEYYYVAYQGSPSNSIAYTNLLPSLKHPYLFFGTGTMSKTTIVHEYGHYYAFAVAPDRSLRLDLAETHSQGNEWLFSAYQSEQYNDFAVRFVNLYGILFDIDTIILDLCLDEFEQMVYANPEKYTDMESLDALYTEIVSNYLDPATFTGVEYWRRSLFENAGYQLSYGISLIPCLELYYLAESDYESAAQMYLALSEYEGDLTFTEVLERAGLQNPFDEEYQVFDFEVLLALMQQKQS
ncbi:MAG: hypothetical protein IIX86_01575 [Clostridia bacterium]|nr:hypothetical protein [Clostridia bacterium]